MPSRSSGVTFLLCLITIFLLFSVATAVSTPIQVHSLPQKPNRFHGLSETSSLSGSNNWDFLLFVQQWPGSQKGPIPPGIGFFTIHGLWATDNNGSWPQYCNDSNVFGQSLIADLLPQMNKYWPSFDGPNAAFWSHEWSRHGTCAMSDPLISGQHAFFQDVLSLYSQENYLTILQNAGMGPSVTQTYALSDMESALNNAVGVTVAIGCQSSPSNLDSVYACIDSNLNWASCGQTQVNSIHSSYPCSSISFPPINDTGNGHSAASKQKTTITK